MIYNLHLENLHSFQNAKNFIKYVTKTVDKTYEKFLRLIIISTP